MATGCEDWQSDIIDIFKLETHEEGLDLTLFNPRRVDFPIGDPNAAPAQIRWEHEKLREADAILFWFSDKTMCPIVLYELGAWSMTTKPIFVGCHKDYLRIMDVVIQTNLVRPEVSIADNITDLAYNVIDWAKCQTED